MKRSRLVIVATGFLMITGMFFSGDLSATGCLDPYWHQIVEPTWKNWQVFFSDARPLARETAGNGPTTEPPAQQTVSGSVWEQAVREALSQQFPSDGDRDLLL